MRRFGAVDWSCDSECDERLRMWRARARSPGRDLEFTIGSTLMVSIYTPCQPLPN